MTGECSRCGAETPTRVVEAEVKAGESAEVAELCEGCLQAVYRIIHGVPVQEHFPEDATDLTPPEARAELEIPPLHTVSHMGDLFPPRPLTEADRLTLKEEAEIREIGALTTNDRGATTVMILVDDWTEGYVWTIEEWLRVHEGGASELDRAECEAAVREARRDLHGISLGE